MNYNFLKNINPDKLQREIQALFETFEYLNTEGENITLVFNSELTTEQVALLNSAVSSHSPIDEYKERVNAILAKQYLASEFLAGFYAQNSDEKNDQFYTEFFDVILRLREGDYTSAIDKLGNKVPSDFFTQSDIDDLISKISLL